MSSYSSAKVTLKGSRYTNMKELRCTASDGAWRIAYAFDPDRKAILLTAGDKSGGSEKRFYRRLIAKADERFDRHLAQGRDEMATTLKEKMAQLPPERRARIEAEADRLHAEYLTLKDLRKAKALTQEQVAAALGIRQATVAQLEKRSGLLLSTLRSYVEAMGGRLRLMVEFPGRPPVALEGLGDTEEPSPGAKVASPVPPAR